MGRMAIAEEIVQGSTRPTLPLEFVKNDGKAVPITTATITGRIKKQGTAAGVNLAGSISVTDGPNGKATLSYAVADVATAGMFVVQITAIISGETYRKKFLQPIEEAI